MSNTATFDRLAAALLSKHDGVAKRSHRETLVGHYETWPGTHLEGFAYPNVVELWVIEDINHHGQDPVPLDELDQWMASTWRES